MTGRPYTPPVGDSANFSDSAVYTPPTATGLTFTTNRVVTVGPTGRDYTSLLAAEAGEQRDLVALNEVAEFVCDAFTDSSSTGMAFSGWTADATRFIIVRAAAGAEAGLVWRTTGAYIFGAGSNSDTIVQVHDGRPRFENIQFAVVTTRAIGGSAYYEVDGCHIRYLGHPSNAGAAQGIIATQVGYAVRNTVFSDFDGTGGGTGRVAIQNGNNSGTKYVYNCTIINCQVGVHGSSGEFAAMVVKNTLVDSRGLVGAVAFSDLGSGFHADSDYNATNLTGAPGASSRNSQTFTNVPEDSLTRMHLVHDGWGGTIHGVAFRPAVVSTPVAFAVAGGAAGSTIANGEVTVTIPSGSNHTAWVLVRWGDMTVTGLTCSQGGATVTAHPTGASQLGFAVTGLVAGSATFTPVGSGANNILTSVIVASDVNQTTPLTDEESFAANSANSTGTGVDVLTPHNGLAAMTYMIDGSGTATAPIGTLAIGNVGPAGYGRYVNAVVRASVNATVRLAQTDVGARTFGTDLTADPSYPFSTDFSGTTRIAPWDIGATETGIREDVSQVAASGGDYTSLSAWEAGEQKDLVATKVREIAECQAFNDTTAVVVSGWTTDATRYIVIRAATGAEAQVPWSTSAYRLSGADSIFRLDFRELFGRIYNIQVEYTDNRWNNGGGIALWPTAHDGEVHVEGCVIRNAPMGDSQGNGTTGLYLGDLAWRKTVLVRNCVAYGFATNFHVQWHNDQVLVSYTLLNCTSYGTPTSETGNGFRIDIVNVASTRTIRNCVNSNTWNIGFTVGNPENGTMSHNASSDATAPGTNSRQSQTFTFVDAAGGNFRLTLDDLGARRFGTDLSADPTYAFNNDLEGRVRHASSWDIGAFQSPEVVVSQVAASGGDYTSLSAWEAAQQKDLVAANEVAVAECQNFEDTAQLILDGWTTSPDNRIRIRAVDNHGGKWSTAAYRFVITDGFFGRSFDYREADVSCEGLQIKTINTSAAMQYWRPIRQDGPNLPATTTNEWDRLLTTFESVVLTNPIDVLLFEMQPGRGMKVRNSLFYGPQNMNLPYVTRYSGGPGSADDVFSNCTFARVQRMAMNFSYDTVFRNCLYAAAGVGSPVGFHDIAYAAGSTNNASTQADSTPGTSPRLSQTFTFVDEAGDDFRLAQTDLGGRRFGTDLSADVTDAVPAEDLAGRLRHASSWDIGAFQSPEVVISQVAATGGDYTSLSAWETGQQKDLVAANEVSVAECQAFEDTTAVTIDGWTTAVDNYIEVRAAAGAEAQVPWSTDAYRLTSTTESCITNEEDCFRVRNIQIHGNYGTDRNRVAVNLGGQETGYVEVSGCVIRGTIVTYPCGGIYYSKGNAPGAQIVVVQNNVVYGFRSDTDTGYGILLDQYGTQYCRNNTVIACATGIWMTSVASTTIAHNNLVDGCVTAFVGTFDTVSHNAASDATAPGTNSRINQTFTFVDAAGGNFRLASTDAGARGYGVNLSTDPDYPFTTDFDGATRTDPWDIGALIAAVAAAGVQSLIGFSKFIGRSFLIR